MAVVTAGKSLSSARGPVKARATLKALMTASVPELVSLISSMDGRASRIFSANATSASVAVPKVEPFSKARRAAARISRRACPRIKGPQERQ